MNEQMTSWLDSIVQVTETAFHKVIWFAPNAIFALLLLLFGSTVGRLIGTFVEKALTKMRISELAASLRINHYLEPFGLKSPQQLMGKLIHFFIFMVTLIAAADVVHLPQVTNLIQTVLLYIPKAIVALLILMVGLGASKLSDGFLKGDLIQRVPSLKGLVRFLIVAFALLSALDQFEISPRLIEILFGGLVFAMSLALGLAFGMGGKEAAKNVLEQLQQKGRK